MTIIVGTNFHAKQTILNFATKFAPKKVFPNFAYSNKSRYQISAETDNFDFSDQICLKRIFPIKNRVNEYDH